MRVASPGMFKNEQTGWLADVSLVMSKNTHVGETIAWGPQTDQKHPVSALSQRRN